MRRIIFTATLAWISFGAHAEPATDLECAGCVDGDDIATESIEASAKLIDRILPGTICQGAVNAVQNVFHHGNGVDSLLRVAAVCGNATRGDAEANSAFMGVDYVQICGFRDDGRVRAKTALHERLRSQRSEFFVTCGNKVGCDGRFSVVLHNRS